MTFYEKWTGFTERSAVRRGLAALGVVALTVGAFTAGRARAAGIPAEETLSYSGVLEDTEGTPLTGNHNIEVRFWDSATGGRSAICTTNGAEFPVTNGHFSVPLPNSCTEAVEGNPDLWIEVVVDGASLGRTKARAVPYAVAAKHAVSADSAKVANAPGGNLATRLTALENGRVTGVGIGDGPLRLCSGSTPPGDTAWRAYGDQIAVTVDISGCAFTSKPSVVSSLSGSTNHWMTTGGSEPYIPDGADAAKQFDIYVRDPAGVTREAANARNWHVTWIAVGN
jgi:hypothetical protein